jgi:hypothetical protein
MFFLLFTQILVALLSFFFLSLLTEIRTLAYLTTENPNLPNLPPTHKHDPPLLRLHPLTLFGVYKEYTLLITQASLPRSTTWVDFVSFSNTNRERRRVGEFGRQLDIYVRWTGVQSTTPIIIITAPVIIILPARLRCTSPTPLPRHPHPDVHPNLHPHVDTDSAAAQEGGRAERGVDRVGCRDGGRVWGVGSLGGR